MSKLYTKGAVLRILFCGLALTNYFYLGVAQNPKCETPDKEPGTCIVPQRCNVIQEKLDSFGGYWNIPNELKRFIQNSRCTGSTRELHICCPTGMGSENKNRNSPQTSTNNKTGREILAAQDCGNINGKRIAFGEEAKLKQFPWMALLEYDHPMQPYKCGGTLITNRYVLTAAHCINTSEKLIGVVLGEHDLNSSRDCQKFARRPVCNDPVQKFGLLKKIAHPGYSRSSVSNDVGVLKLDRDVVFSAQISPVCLPLYEKLEDLDFTESYFIAGWGKTQDSRGSQSSTLQYAALDIKTNKYCEDKFKRAFDNVHLCAVGKERQDSCKGDSGGPLFGIRLYQNIKKYIQYGIVSFGVSGCGVAEQAYPAIYANVIELLPWIEENIVD